jgi:hypothetical protein
MARERIKELLVDRRIEEGQQLLAELFKAGFEVTVAFWARTQEDGSWFLYIGSPAVAPGKFGAAFVTTYDGLARLPDTSIEVSDIKLLPAKSPIARDALALRDRQNGRMSTTYHGKRLGNLTIDEAYIYPRTVGPLTSTEVLQTLLTLATRPAGAPAPSALITLRDGSSLRALITGFHWQVLGELTLNLLDPVTNTRREITAADVVNLQ